MSRRLTGFLLFLIFIQPAYAAEFFCLSQDVTCLIAAINVANSNGEENFISLEAGIYSLTSVDNETDGPNGLPSIVGKLMIVGAGADTTVIERDSSSLAFRIFHVSASGVLSLERLSVTGGLGGGDNTSGAGIFNLGTLTMANGIIARNSAGFRGNGGGIDNLGTMTVLNSVITDNRAPSRGSGGGIANSGILSISGSTISMNSAISADGPSGGGIQNFSGTLTITNSSIFSNRSVSAGGIGNAGTLTITSSTIANNTAGLGGGIRHTDFFGGTATITNSTVAQNSGTNGGGVTGRGINLQNTIVALNSGGAGADCSGAITSLGNNLIGEITGCTVDLLPSDLTGDPALGEFIDDGTPGHGHFKPLAGSQLIDSGNPDACPQTDQLGFSRLGICDIGSVEFQGTAIVVVAIDIRPRGEANRINPNSNKEIPVAIFSADAFDATTIDPATVLFGATGAEAAAVSFTLRDVDGDGDTDMILRFEIRDTGIRCGDSSASVTGQTSSGLSFTGSNPVKTTGCKR
jgi:hypothetical protein